LVHLNSTNSMSGTLPQGSSGSPNAQTAHCHMPVSCNHVAAPPAQFKFAHHQLYYCQDLFERQIQFEFAHSSMSSQQTAWTVPLTASLANTTKGPGSGLSHSPYSNILGQASNFYSFCTPRHAEAFWCTHCTCA